MFLDEELSLDRFSFSCPVSKEEQRGRHGEEHYSLINDDKGVLLDEEGRTRTPRESVVLH